MPILVKHSGNMAPTAYGAFGGGRGKREAEESAEALRRKQQKDLQARALAAQAAESERQRQFAAQQAEDSRDWTSDQNKQSRDAQAEQADLTRKQQLALHTDSQDFAREEGGLNRDAASTAAKIAADRARQNIDYAGERALEFEDERARQTYNRGVEGIKADLEEGRLTQEEADEAFNQLRQHSLGLDRYKKSPKPKPREEGRNVGDSWTADGYLWTRDEKGIPKKIGEDRTVKTPKDRVDAYKVAVEMKKGDKEGGIAPDKRPIGQIVEEILSGTGEAAVDAEVEPEETEPAALSASDELKVQEADELLGEIASHRAEMAKGNKKRGPDWNPLASNRLKLIAAAEKKLRDMGMSQSDINSGPTKPADVGLDGRPRPSGRDRELAYWESKRNETKPTELLTPPTITTDADYAKLPSGTLFTAPDGSIRRKP